MPPNHGTSLTDSTTIMASPGQTSAGMPGETVILHPGSGRYFGLDGVGDRVWQLVQSPRTFGEIRAMLLEEYEVEPERCERDLRGLVARLAERDLVVVGDDASR